MTSVSSSGSTTRSGRPRRELTQVQMAIGLAVGIVGAFIGTIVFLIVITIIVGLADGH